MKYKKKSVVIEAMQFTDTDKDRVYAWASSLQMNICPSFRDSKPVLLIPTLEGEMTASIGDYIIRGVNGELYPCKPDIFDKTYTDAMGRMSFGEAVEAVRSGIPIAREGWNGKGMFVVYQKGYPDGIPCNTQTAKAWGIKEGELFKCEPYLQIRMVNGSHAMWVPSINDVLADDWHGVKWDEGEING